MAAGRSSLAPKERVAYKPVIMRNVLTLIELVAESSRSFCEGCAVGIEPNKMRIKEHLDNSLMLVTALNPHIGYEKGAKISLTAYLEGTSLREAALKLGFLSAEHSTHGYVPKR